MSVNPWMVVGQIVAYAGFIAAIGYFSVNPAYVHRDPAMAQITMSFSHTGARVSECRKLTAQEIEALAANMRRSVDCPRGRLPLVLRLELNGDVVYDSELPPAGIANDGASFVYTRLAVPSGRHRLVARLRDSARTQGYDHVHEESIFLAGSQNFTVDFRPEAGGFIFR